MQAHYFGCRITPNAPDQWTRFDIDAPLADATGGEGGIFVVKGTQPRRVAKIYNPRAKATLNPNAFEALAFLTAAYDDYSGAMPFVAWPMEVLFTEQKPLPINQLAALAGITMRHITGHETLEKLTTYGTGRVGLGNEAAVRIAATIAGQLKVMHRYGIVFCDLNPRNILVSRKRDSVMFVDADAFQHAITRNVFTKPHFTDGYASIDHLNNKPGPRTPADDNFVLAIHIFQLLTDGGHPFKSGATYSPPDAPLFGISVDDNILARRWPYSDIALYNPPASTLQPYLRLHPELKAMFTRAFQHFDPPTAEEWQNLLPKFRVNADAPGNTAPPPNTKAVSKPPAAPSPAPRPSVAPNASRTAPPPPTSTRVVPPLRRPKRSPLMRVFYALGAILRFILLVIVTLLRGGPFAVLKLLAALMGSAAYQLGRAYPRATLGSIAATILALVINAYATTTPERPAPPPAPHFVHTPAFAPSHSALTTDTVPLPLRKPAPPTKEASAEPELLPWKIETTPAARPTDKPANTLTWDDVHAAGRRNDNQRFMTIEEVNRRRANEPPPAAGFTRTPRGTEFRLFDQPVFTITGTSNSR